MTPQSKTYLLLSAIGLLIFFTIGFTFSFKDKVFRTFFPRPLSYAQELSYVPQVRLLAGVDNSFKAAVFNMPEGERSVTLKWKTEGDPTSCAGNFWSNVKKTDSWEGSKEKDGGSLTVSDNFKAGIYVYSINCANEYGDSAGSSITINVGAQKNSLRPQLVTFSAYATEDKPLDTSKPVSLSKDTSLQILWSALNTETTYGVCVATGSWPTIYHDTGSLKVKETFILEKAKIYQYQIICSNEYGYDSHMVSFVVK